MDTRLVAEMMSELGGQDLLRFVSRGYELMARMVMEQVGIRELTLENAWDAFPAMMPYMPDVKDAELAFAMDE